MLELTVCHLYPELLNLYGDNGNLVALEKRCQWRNINLNIKNCSIDNAADFDDVDIIFIGSGADREQSIAQEHMFKIKHKLEKAVEEDKVILAIGGGYQLLGRYNNKRGEGGLGLLDFYTEMGDGHLVGEIIVKMGDYYLVGFENHLGRTYLNGVEPLGFVISGYGNNGKDKTEGVHFKNVIGTYLHGPLLPKNPKLCDDIIYKALKNKYNVKSISELDDFLEIKAREHFLKSINAKFTSLA